MAGDKGGVKPPLIGRFTGRVRTPLTILAAFFALGVILDLLMQLIAQRLIKSLQNRLHLGFKFWFTIADDVTWTMPDGTVVPYNETIAYDDVILLIITFGIPFILMRRTTLRNKLIAAAGFFFGWYASSLWIGPHIPVPPLEASSPPHSEASSIIASENETGSPVAQP